MRILVIAPHMDDEVLGMGGTIARHVEQGDEVCVCFVAHRVYGHSFDEGRNRQEILCAEKAKAVLGYKDARFLNLPDERLDACLQDIIIPLEQYFGEIQPEVVYVNHRGDNNQDHQAVFKAAMVVVRPASNHRLRSVLCYETPSSTDQSPPVPEMVFLPNCHINIARYLARKLEALECYSTELRQFPHPRSVEGLKTLAKKRGIEGGFEAAEAFVILRDRRGTE